MEMIVRARQSGFSIAEVRLLNMFIQSVLDSKYTFVKKTQQIYIYMFLENEKSEKIFLISQDGFVNVMYIVS